MKFHPCCLAFPDIEGEEFDELAADIKEYGLHDSITVFNGLILDGRHRYLICEKLGIEPKFVEFDGDYDAAEAFAISKNKKRRTMTSSQWAMVLEELAIARSGAQKGNDHWKHKSTKLYSYNESSVGGVAKKHGGSSRTNIFHARNVKRDGAPEVVKAVKQGKVKVSDAAQVLDMSHEDQRELLKRFENDRDRTMASGKKIMLNERLKDAPMPELPTGPYQVVVVDPPWPIEPAYDRPNRPVQQVGAPYPTMTIDEIKAMKLPLADDAWVLLWTIKQFLRDSFEVLDAWEVEYDDIMVWHKPHGPQSAGRMQSNREFVMVGKKGSPKWRDTKQFQACFNAPKPKAHSTKPEEFYATIKRCTVGPRADLFSRRKIDGFMAWGKEANL